MISPPSNICYRRGRDASPLLKTTRRAVIGAAAASLFSPPAHSTAPDPSPLKAIAALLANDGGDRSWATLARLRGGASMGEAAKPAKRWRRDGERMEPALAVEGVRMPPLGLTLGFHSSEGAPPPGAHRLIK